MGKYNFKLKIYLLQGLECFQMELEIFVKQVCMQCLSTAWPHLLLKLINKLISGSGEVPFKSLKTKIKKLLTSIITFQLGITTVTVSPEYRQVMFILLLLSGNYKI